MIQLQWQGLGEWDYSQGTAAHRHGGCVLGQPMAGEVSGGALQQHGSGGHSELRLQQRA